MPEIKETSILIDHDTGKVLIDTNSKGIASLLVRRGFVEFGGELSIPYRRFEGQERQISFRGTKRKSPSAINNLKKARNGKALKSKLNKLAENKKGNHSA